MPQENEIQQQQQGRICNGDCFGCSYQQVWMCASVHSKRTMRMMEQLVEKVNTLQEQVSELQEKLSTETLLNPLAQAPETKPSRKKQSQKPSGEDNRLAVTNK